MLTKTGDEYISLSDWQIYFGVDIIASFIQSVYNLLFRTELT